MTTSPGPTIEDVVRVVCGRDLAALSEARTARRSPPTGCTTAGRPAGEDNRRRDRQASSEAMNRPCQVWYQTAPLVALTDNMPSVLPEAAVSIVK